MNTYSLTIDGMPIPRNFPRRVPTYSSLPRVNVQSCALLVLLAPGAARARTSGEVSAVRSRSRRTGVSPLRGRGRGCREKGLGNGRYLAVLPSHVAPAPYIVVLLRSATVRGPK